MLQAASGSRTEKERREQGHQPVSPAGVLPHSLNRHRLVLQSPLKALSQSTSPSARSRQRAVQGTLLPPRTVPCDGRALTNRAKTTGSDYSSHFVPKLTRFVSAAARSHHAGPTTRMDASVTMTARVGALASSRGANKYAIQASRYLLTNNAEGWK